MPKKFITKIFTIVSVMALILLAACKTQTETVVTDSGLSYAPNWTKSFAPDTLSVSQLDSVSVADRLPSFNKWRSSVFKDNETSKNTVYFTILDPETNIIYTVKQLEKDKYVLFKKLIQ